MNYADMLEQHCEKLEAVENMLFETLTEQEADDDRRLKKYELWLTAQNQLRLTVAFS